ncbi:hypothetical protein RhiirA1_486041 [Rhizophagus irregularis]|uniref:Uncharacterized protein n=1 Tax=Rhizophagus irregularis TaxID=588596 RepID=A0A2I1E3E4_9GLOM|nr:hypothetical protein RhiirA1_486041 [Rhizophagus irregularis]PKY16636.1 hypothetical protein RhiirB3_429095 [Rhizophagus irregularis]
MGKSNKKKSSQQSIPCGDVESLFYTTATAKLVPKDDIVTERSILDNVRITKLFTRTLNQAIISGARCKAHQQLDSLSSRYQNALPLLIQNAAEAQLKKKGEEDDNVDPDTIMSQPNQEGLSRTPKNTYGGHK